jgi:hypothetical protein
MRLRTAFSALTLGAALAVTACGDSQTQDCAPGDEKCDDPGSAADRECREMCGSDFDCMQECRVGKGLEFCEARKADAVLSSQKAYVEDAIRWACADVEGVNTNGGDDRGQEYCEYFTVFQPPPEAEGGELPAPVELGRGGDFGIELTEDQIFALEDEPDAVVGQCIFTSWHSDIDEELPNCSSDAGCNTVSVADDAERASWMESTDLGLEMNRREMQMQGGINSNGAAVDLVNRCITKTPSPPEDVREDDYMRGCWGAFELFKTEWRRSDPTICMASMRLGECGCALDVDQDGVADITDPLEIAKAVVPKPSNGEVPLRGFKLGTWTGAQELPAGCRYLDTGDDSQTIVGCDLTATDLLSSASDPKDRCREKYGANVVVHIPIPSELVLCNPPEDGEFASTCGETVPFAAPDAPAAE